MITKEIEHVLVQHPLGLIFDIDGTISEIAATPDEAFLYPGAAEYLQTANRYAHVAIVTGRGIKDGASKVNVEGLTYIGTHGLEWSQGLPETHPAELQPEAKPYVEPGQKLLDFVEKNLVPEIPGLIVQRKSIGGSLHYRQVKDPEQVRQRILTALAEPAHQLHMRIGEGKRVVEILAPLTINKGTALHRLVERFKLQGLIFAGDDRTDLNGFYEIERLRQQGFAALAIAVQHQDSLPELLEHANVTVQGVGAMVQLLKDITDYLSKIKAQR
jgi:trehalose-phosphatase